MLIFGSAGEQLMSTFSTNIYACRRNTHASGLNKSQMILFYTLTNLPIFTNTIQKYCLVVNITL